MTTQKHTTTRLMIAASVLGSVALMATPARAGLLGYWNFNEGSGITAADFSSHGNHGTLKGTTTPPAWVAGHTGKPGDYAVHINAGSGYPRVEVPHHSSLELTAPTAFTLAVWLYDTGSTAYSRMFMKGAHYGLHKNSGDNFAYYSSSVASNVRMNPIDGWVGAWHHYAVTYDGTTLRQYYDGVLNATWVGPAVGVKNTLPLLIGADNTVTNRGFIGYLDDVVIFDSVEDVEQIMNGTHPAMRHPSGTVIMLR